MVMMVRVWGGEQIVLTDGDDCEVEGVVVVEAGLPPCVEQL
jgi:hypothetical protein